VRFGETIKRAKGGTQIADPSHLGESPERHDDQIVLED
jgi:hypothetical protein